jgi:chromosome segregation ATPase
VVAWLGDPGAAATASTVLSTPLDLVSLQLLLEQHLGPACSLRELDGPRDAAYRALEAERDALRAELDVLRHEGEEARRGMREATGTARRAFDTTVIELNETLSKVTADLQSQRKTAAALQSAYGEVEQAHGKLLQRHEAMKAERDAMAERARDVSLLREQLELTQRDHARARSELEALRAEVPMPPLEASPQEASSAELIWDQERLATGS